MLEHETLITMACLVDRCISMEIALIDNELCILIYYKYIMFLYTLFEHLSIVYSYLYPLMERDVAQPTLAWIERVKGVTESN